MCNYLKYLTWGFVFVPFCYLLAMTVIELGEWSMDNCERVRSVESEMHIIGQLSELTSQVNGKRFVSA